MVVQLCRKWTGEKRSTTPPVGVIGREAEKGMSKRYFFAIDP